jgi:hypothetical protein
MSNEFLSIGNTLKATWLELKLAKLFGQEIEVVDEYGMKITQSLYRGRLYFIDYVDTKNT